MNNSIKVLGRINVSEDNFNIMWQNFAAEYESLLHSHEFYEIELTVSGKADEFVNGELYSKVRGSVTVSTPADFHSFDVKEDVELVNVLFTDKCLSDIGASNLLFSKKTQRVFYLDDRKTEDLISLCKILASAKAYDKKTRESISTKLLDTIVLLLLSETDVNAYKLKESKMTDIEQALHFIDLHYSENPTVNTVAEAIGKSPNYFSKYFKKSTGRHYSDYLNNRKVESAEMLLRTSDMSITDVCFNCGFNSLSNFLRVFKAIKGMKPSEYRRKHQSLRGSNYKKDFQPF